MQPQTQQTSKPEPRAPKSHPFPDLPPYRPPKTGLVSYLPASLVPYAELMRLHKPAGYYAFYFPHLFGTLYASILLSPRPAFSHLLRINLIFMLGSLILRGAACTWNDTLDASYDRLVARCRHRPIARGAVSPLAANIFTLAQSLLGYAILCLLPSACLVPAALLTVTMGVYPLGKRVTNYPQLVLGFSFALGQLVGTAGMGFDPLRQTQTNIVAAMACFYASNVVNTVIYDAVYAHQDLKDDLKAGVKSVAVAWRDRTKPILYVLAVAEVGFLAAAGRLVDMGIPYFTGAVAGTAAVLGSMLWTVRLDVPEDCWRWFKWTIWLTGGTLSGGLLAEYLALAAEG
ncbi:Para-hydroxybenzoate--polyprenyltransferase, mitochondrial precursor (PHB:polyprenyltransferase) [Loxospora ochrophaea]|nr:Para-hydroxybenzoate--polyprenyltransferase, mitochondrial precursor (PHB:polyprenyltransferase) [Loxospora ochrophaea]